MAGIGFELKRIFTKGGIFNSLRGAFYASMTTVGPLIMIVVVLAGMYIFLDYSTIGFLARDLMAATTLYVFIFSLIVTSPINSVLSRYIADKIYDHKEKDILPSYYVGLFINIIIASLLGVPFCLAEYFVGHVDALYVFASYCMYISMVFIFFSMTYISALKEYKKITFSFLFGLIIAFIAATIMVKVLHMPLDRAIIYSLTIGFIIIAFLLFSLIQSFFRENSGDYKDCLHYFKKYKMLFFVNLFYILGLYTHNFIFWGSSMQIRSYKVFISAPVYDMATCIAMFINISTMIIFIVQVETDFHERYVKYCEAIIGGTSTDIKMAKRQMLKTLTSRLSFVFQFQLIINVIIYLLAILFLPRFGTSNLTLEILPSLAVAYFAIFLMYCLIVFLYYFDDIKGALLTAFLFFAVSTGLSFVCLHANPSLYGAGLFVGAFIAFTFGFFRLRYVEKHLEEHIFCRGTIIPKEEL